MTSIRFIHTSDIHLDSPFKGLAKIKNNNIYKEIRQSTFNAFDRIIDYCIEYQVDFLIIAGDTYDSADKSLKAQIHLLRGLERLDKNRISTYIIHGNHDPKDQKKSLINWPKSVHFFSAEEVEMVKHIREGKEIAKIYGRSFPTKAFNQNIASDYTAKNEEVLQLGILHTNVDGDINHDNYAPCSIKELFNSNIDYWALGHIHQKSILSKKNPAIIYSGNPQGRHINEEGLKGAYLIEVKNKLINSIDFLPTSEIIWLEEELDVSNKETFEAILNFIQESLDRLIDYYQKPLILQIKLVGNTSLHKELKNNERIMEIKDILNDANSSQKKWIWIESITRNTFSSYNVEDLLEQGNFLSDYLNLLLRTKANIYDQELYKEIAEELFNNRSLKKHLFNLSSEDIDEVLKRVLNLSLEYFHEEGIS